MTIFGKLPLELIGLVLSYDGIYKLRNGVFMKQFAKNDLRYDLFDMIPKPKVSITSSFTFIYVDFNEQYYTDGIIRSIKITINNRMPFGIFLYQYSNLLHDDLLERRKCLTYLFM